MPGWVAAVGILHGTQKDLGFVKMGEGHRAAGGNFDPRKV